MPHHPRVSLSPTFVQGQLVIASTGLPVEVLLRRFAAGETEADLVDAFPGLTVEDIRDGLATAADMLAAEPITITFPEVGGAVEGKRPRGKRK